MRTSQMATGLSQWYLHKYEVPVFIGFSLAQRFIAGLGDESCFQPGLPGFRQALAENAAIWLKPLGKGGEPPSGYFTSPDPAMNRWAKEKTLQTCVDNNGPVPWHRHEPNRRPVDFPSAQLKFFSQPWPLSRADSVFENEGLKRGCLSLLPQLFLTKGILKRPWKAGPALRAPQAAGIFSIVAQRKEHGYVFSQASLLRK